MSDFWARKLGIRPAPPPRQTSFDAWWANPAGPQPDTQPPPLYPPAPEPQQAPQYAPSPQSAARSAMVKAQWAKNPMNCPECGSGDYFKDEESGAKARCMTCGYPVRHSTSGVSIPAGMAPATPTRQLPESRTNNFQPHTIVGRIG